MKVLILDSGILINFSMNGFLNLFEEMKKVSSVRFAITEKVKYETVDRPIGIPRFELGALRVKEMIENKVLEMPEDFGVQVKKLDKLTSELMNLANRALQTESRWLNIVSEGEISCLALSEELTQKGIENLIGVDERTTRLLSEKPEALERIMSEKLHRKVFIKNNLQRFSNFRFIRSPELIYVAYKKGILKTKEPKMLEAAIYATKFKGSAISWEEINELKKL